MSVTPFKCSEIKDKNPSEIFRIEKNEYSGVTYMQTKSQDKNRFMVLAEDKDWTLKWGFKDVSDPSMSENERSAIYDDNKKMYKLRMSASDMNNFGKFIGRKEFSDYIQSEFKRNLTKKGAEKFDSYVNDETYDDKDDERVVGKYKEFWPLKAVSQFYRKDGVEYESKQFEDEEGNFDPKATIDFLLSGGDAKWPARFPINSLRNQEKRTIFYDTRTLRVENEGTPNQTITADEYLFEGNPITIGNISKALPPGTKITKIILNFDGGSVSPNFPPGWHFTVLKVWVIPSDDSELDDNQDEEMMELARQMMGAKATTDIEDPPKDEKPAKEPQSEIKPSSDVNELFEDFN